MGLNMTSDRYSIEHYEGCLLGGAVGDALGAPVEFMPLREIIRKFGPDGITQYAPAFGKIGAITDDTQMTIFTAEGLLRAGTRRSHKGICHPPSVVYHAYQRWLMTQQGEPKDDEESWLLGVKELYSRRAPGNSCLSALKREEKGTISEPINDSKGCGGVMRIAPVGLIPNWSNVFNMGCEVAALTHGHPIGYLAAGCLAQIIRYIIEGSDLLDAIEATKAILVTYRNHKECLDAINAAIDPEKLKNPSFKTVESLGEGWIAEEALAIGIYCALTSDGDFEKGLYLSVNHSGDSDSTGSIAGNIMGALYGVSAIPNRYLVQLELADIIKELAEDLYVGYRHSEDWWDKYPGH